MVDSAFDTHFKILNFHALTKIHRNTTIIFLIIRNVLFGKTLLKKENDYIVQEATSSRKLSKRLGNN